MRPLLARNRQLSPAMEYISRKEAGHLHKLCFKRHRHRRLIVSREKRVGTESVNVLCTRKKNHPCQKCRPGLGEGLKANQSLDFSYFHPVCLSTSSMRKSNRIQHYEDVLQEDKSRWCVGFGSAWYLSWTCTNVEAAKISCWNMCQEL